LPRPEAAMTLLHDAVALKPKDFATDQDVRWCPGCGDYAILAAVQRALAKQGIPPHLVATVAGIGCSSRFPYYMATYGFHSIHGRAPAIATGLKIARPDLQVWMATGDGDSLSIGGNHFIHLLRRNVDIKVLLFNNRIYGLTKGQYSPTSEIGKKTKSSPQGSVDNPFKPVSLAIGAEASFVARFIDVDAKVAADVLAAAAAHKGTAFIEILQNCNIFNDGAWSQMAEKETRAETTILLEHDKPMIFGAKRDKGIRLRGLKPEIVKIGEDGVTEADLWVHDAYDEDLTRTFLLSRFDMPDFPIPIGVLRAVQRPVYDSLVNAQVDAQRAVKKQDLQVLLDGAKNWIVG
jgi:2-oxoglutarate ferredoxin oxidoreductase subunit beta